MDELFERYKPKGILDLNVVPILDMLISVIFFLLLSTTFIGYTKLQVPPASVSTVTSPVAPEPLQPKLMITAENEEGQVSGQVGGRKVKLILAWKGEKPSRVIKHHEIPQDDSRAKTLETVTHEMLAKFKEKYSSEKTLQIGLSAGLPYQYLIAAMDASRETVPDVVLIDYNEAEAISKEYRE